MVFDLDEFRLSEGGDELFLDRPQEMILDSGAVEAEVVAVDGRLGKVQVNLHHKQVGLMLG